MLSFVAASLAGEQYTSLAALSSREGNAGTGGLEIWLARLMAWLEQPSAPIVRFNSAPAQVGVFLEVSQTPMCQVRDALTAGSSPEPACSVVRLCTSRVCFSRLCCSTPVQQAAGRAEGGSAGRPQLWPRLQLRRPISSCHSELARF